MLTYDLAQHSESPLYESLYRCIRDDILAGALLPHDRLPSKRSFARNLGVSVITVEGAYRQLAAEGYIASHERKGYYVQDIAPRQTAPKPQKEHVVEHEKIFSVADFSSTSSQSSASFARLWERALRDTFTSEPEESLYACQPAQGSLRLRQAIASWLGHSRGIVANPDQIVITAGAPMLYSLVALLMENSSTVALESPGYRRLPSVYEALGMHVAYLPLDQEGIDCNLLEQSDAKLVHVMPSHQFPTGRVTSIARRYKLLGWASHAEGRYIVEDDYDCEFRLSGKPIPALSSIDTEGKVIYLSTFSNSLSPSLRIAFGVFPPEFESDLERMLRCFSATVGSINQIALARIIESGIYDRHINKHRNTARNARDCFINALRATSMVERFMFEEYNSGLHFVLSIKTDAKAHDIAEEAEKHGVCLVPLEDYDMGSLLAPDDRARFVMQYDGIEHAALMSAACIICKSVAAAEHRAVG